MTHKPYTKEKEGLLAGAGCADWSSHDTTLQWTVVTIQPNTEVF